MLLGGLQATSGKKGSRRGTSVRLRDAPKAGGGKTAQHAQQRQQRPFLSFEALEAAGPSQLKWTATQRDWLAGLLNSMFDGVLVWQSI
jgi:hypothetical protein